MPKSTELGDHEVEMNRRRKERREPTATTEFKPPRRKKQRRRQIDPTTCERDYSGEEIEFMQSLDAYKRSSGRMFPTCSEILEVVRGMGYVRLSEEERGVLDGIAAVENELAGAVGSPDDPFDDELDGELADLDEEFDDE